jgi:hypothetical protein
MSGSVPTISKRLHQYAHRSSWLGSESESLAKLNRSVSDSEKSAVLSVCVRRCRVVAPKKVPQKIPRTVL